jgi:uncharacterized membrane protein
MQEVKNQKRSKKLPELQAEESRAVFYAGMGGLIFMIIILIFKFSTTAMLVWSVILMVGAYLMDEANKKFNFLGMVRRS